jgi:hypothetical protein
MGLPLSQPVVEAIIAAFAPLVNALGKARLVFYLLLPPHACAA